MSEVAEIAVHLTKHLPTAEYVAGLEARVKVLEAENRALLDHCRICNRVKELEEALRRSTQALDDWTSTYASEFCDEARVGEAWDRIQANGGTLAYIAGIVHPNHQMLKR